MGTGQIRFLFNMFFQLVIDESGTLESSSRRVSCVSVIFFSRRTISKKNRFTDNMEVKKKDALFYFFIHTTESLDIYYGINNASPP